MRIATLLFVLACCGAVFAASSFVLSIDGSGSMTLKIDGTKKFEIARNATQCLIDSIPEGDEGAIYVYETSHTITRVQPFTTSKGTLRSAAAGMDSEFGMTDLRGGINESATYAIQSAQNPNKFVIILSDGGSASMALNRTTAAFREQGVRIYVVGLAVRTNQTTGVALGNIAENGGGQFYSTLDYPTVCDALKQAYLDGAAGESTTGGGKCCPMLLILPAAALVLIAAKK